jgi:hypothetical protein
MMTRGHVWMKKWTADIHLVRLDGHRPVCRTKARVGHPAGSPSRICVSLAAG